MICPYCNEPMEYIGNDDGGGDYGTAICETWCCEYCDYCEEGDCIEVEDELELETFDYNALKNKLINLISESLRIPSKYFEESER